MNSLLDDDDWGRPTEQSGEFARVEQLAGHLLLVFPIGYIDHHPTRFSQPGKKSDVIVCDLVDLDAVDEMSGNRGKVYRNAWWRQAQLIIALRPFIGKKVMGRLGKGISRNGLNPPWVLNDATQEPGTIDLARQWAAANPGFVVSQFAAPTLPAAPVTQPQQFQQPQPQFGPPPNAYQQPQYPQPTQNQLQQPAQPQYQQVNNDPWAQPFTPSQPYTPPPAANGGGYGPTPQYQGPPAIPVEGSTQMDAGMLALMRAKRERGEVSGYGQQPDMPPF